MAKAKEQMQSLINSKRCTIAEGKAQAKKKIKPTPPPKRKGNEFVILPYIMRRNLANGKFSYTVQIQSIMLEKKLQISFVELEKAKEARNEILKKMIAFFEDGKPFEFSICEKRVKINRRAPQMQRSINRMKEILKESKQK